MTGIYIFGGLIVVGVVAFIFLKVKWARSGKKESRRREEKSEDERNEAVAKSEARIIQLYD